MGRVPLPALLVALALASPRVAQAHDLAFTETLLLIRSDGTWQADVTADLDALALGAGPGADSAALAAELRAMSAAERAERRERLRQLFLRRVRVLFDGQPAPFDVAFPHAGTPLAERGGAPSALGTVARLEGRVPERAREVAFRASRSFPPVQLTVLFQTEITGRRALLERGAPSDPIPLHPATEAAPDRLLVGGRYLVLGFWHIVPEGLDHILFVLGLFLLSPRPRPLLWQVSAFTIAHTLTLAAASQGVVALSPRIVEPLIALSIAWVAAENVATGELKPWRPVVVFAFGLLHGLGFAGVLAGLGLPQGELLTALVAFNAGVELGQLAVIGAAFLILGAFLRRPWYRRRVAVPLSVAIAATGLYWAVQRTLGS